MSGAGALSRGGGCCLFFCWVRSRLGLDTVASRRSYGDRGREGQREGGREGERERGREGGRE